MRDTIAKIKQYFGSASQFPLLVVVSPEEYQEVLQANQQEKIIYVSGYCVGADKEPDIAKLEKDVRSSQGNSLLLGFGDYLVSKAGEAKKYLTRYKAMTLQPKSHVVILLGASMYPVLKDIIKEDPRTVSRVVLPEDVPQNFVVNEDEVVYGIKAYLKACEMGNPPGKVKTALRIANVTVIDPENHFAELNNRYPAVFKNLSPANGTPEYWRKLLAAFDGNEKDFRRYLEGHRFSPPELCFLKYAKSNDYVSWLYFIWLKIFANSRDYLGFVVSKTTTSDDLLETAKNAILDIGLSDSRFPVFYEQRKTLLKGCSDADIANFIPLIHRHGTDRIAYLTDNTKREKQEVLVALGEGAKGDYLQTSYPALFAYLQDYRIVDESLTAYFSAYKKCKVYNTVDASFAELVKVYGAKRPYNSLPTRSTVFSDIKTDRTLLIFLDALGVEYLGYIQKLCAEFKLKYDPTIARANLPTITGVNREFYDEWQGQKENPIKTIDDLKHNPERGYDFHKSPYPIHLPEELDAVREAVERAAVKLRAGDFARVIIASDHGASRLAVISPDVIIDSGGCEAKSSGRYCQGAVLPKGDNITKENDYAIVADYSRFRGSRSASVEVHGGATLEEILVPIIMLTLETRSIQVTFENNVAEVSHKKPAELILIITPDCDNVTTRVSGTNYKAEKLEKSRFRVVLQGLKKGQYTMEIYENHNYIVSKDFTIKSKGIEVRDDF